MCIRDSFNPELAIQNFLQSIRVHSLWLSPALSIKKFLSPAGRSLSSFCVSPARSRFMTSWVASAPGAYGKAYDQFLESCTLWDEPVNPSLSFREAYLRLCHPTHPTTSTALKLIRRMNHDLSGRLLNPSSPKQKLETFQFLFTTIDMLRREGQSGDAAWLMDLLNNRFASDLSFGDELPQAVSDLSGSETDDVSRHGAAEEFVNAPWGVAATG